MTEVFRAYFYNAKKKQMRSKGNMILMFALFAFLIVGVLGGTFTFVALGICGGLTAAGAGWLYFSIMSGIAIALGAFGSVFNTYSSLYLPKDNDLLLSMPIPVRTIIISRLLNVYLLGTMYSATVMIPTLVIYWMTAGATAANVICGIILFIIVTLLVLMLSCLLGWVVAKISLKLKNKSFITVIISLAFIGGYYYLYFKAQDLMRELVMNASEYGTNIKASAYILYLFGRIGEGDILATAIFTAATAALLALTIFILSRSFLKLATASGSTKKVLYREKEVKQQTAFGALLKKEIARFTSSPNYMLNCGLGVLLLPAMGIFLLVKSDILAIIGEVIQGVPNCDAFIVCAMLMMLSTMNDMATPSTSLEGRSIWIPQSLPVEAKTVLRAKAVMQLILTEIPMLFAAVCCAIAVQGSIAVKLLVCIVPMLFALFMAMFDTFTGVKSPIMEWTTEIVPIKQGGAIAIALFGGWGFVAVFAIPYFFIGSVIGLPIYLTIWAVVYLVTAILLYRWLNTKGATAFSKL